jgi:hypothetical protein
MCIGVVCISVVCISGMIANAAGGAVMCVTVRRFRRRAAM